MWYLIAVRFVHGSYLIVPALFSLRLFSSLYFSILSISTLVVLSPFFATGLVVASQVLPTNVADIPAPCDQLISTAHQKQCAAFLSVEHHTGGATFAKAVSVSDTEDFLRQIVANVPGGLVIVLEDHVTIDLTGPDPVAPLGKVALVGNPDDRPRVRPKENNLLSYFVQVYGLADGFYAWGIEWDTAPEFGTGGGHVSGVLSKGKNYNGPMRITHCVFRHNPDSPNKLTPPANYLFLERVSSQVYIAHNQFYTDETTDEVILVNCSNDCDTEATLTIHNNQWLAPFTPVDNNNYKPYLEAIRLYNIPKAEITENEEMDAGARSSIIVRYDFANQAVDLVITGNSARMDSNVISRQLTLSATRYDHTIGQYIDVPLQGTVVLSDNDCYQLNRQTGFLTSYCLDFDEGDSFCSNASSLLSDFEPVSQTGALTVTATPVGFLSSILCSTRTSSSDMLVLTTGSAATSASLISSSLISSASAGLPTTTPVQASPSSTRMSLTSMVTTPGITSTVTSPLSSEFLMSDTVSETFATRLAGSASLPGTVTPDLTSQSLMTEPPSLAILSSTSVIPSGMTPVASAPPLQGAGNNSAGEIIGYTALGIGGLVFVAISWQVLWITVYWHFSGTLQNAANILGGFLPGYIYSRLKAPGGVASGFRMERFD